MASVFNNILNLIVHKPVMYLVSMKSMKRRETTILNRCRSKMYGAPTVGFYPIKYHHYTSLKKLL